MDHPDRTVRAGRTSDRNDMIIEAMVLLFTNIEKDKAFYSQLVKGGTGQISRYRKKMCAGSIA